MESVEKPLIKSDGYISETSDSASVGRISRTVADQIMISFQREAPYPLGDDYQLCKLALATFTMSEEQARALHSTLGKILGIEQRQD